MGLLRKQQGKHKKLVIRQAEVRDVNFLLETIVTAEKSGTEKLSYCGVFSLNESAVVEVLRRIILEDFAGQELCLSGFLIVEIDGKYAAATCSWVEASGGLSSDLIKANLLRHHMPLESMASVLKWAKKLTGLIIPREPGAIQLESVYVRSEYRGQGALEALFSAHIEAHKTKNRSPRKIQIVTSGGNSRANAAYKKMGFDIVYKRSIDSLEIQKILPSCEKFLLEKNLKRGSVPSTNID